MKTMSLRTLVKQSTLRWIAASCCALLAMTSDGWAQQGQLSPRVITVNGEAKRAVVPDEAHVYVAVQAKSAKLANAKAEHDKKLKSLLKLAGDMGIEEKYRKTQHSSVHPEYDYIDGRQKFRGYMVSSAIDLTVKKTETIGDLMEKLAAGGFEQTSFNYTVSNMEAVRDAIIADAIKNARGKAERMSAAAGAEIKRVYSISEGGVNFPQPVPMMAMAMRGGADMAMEKAVAPPAGEQEINANVTVSFELKE